MNIQKGRWFGVKYIFGISIASMAILSMAFVSSQLTQTANAAGQVFTVTNTADSGVGSLRQAITDLNANATTGDDPNKIVFNIPNADPSNPQVHTIALATALPEITQPVSIDGMTQPGSSCGELVKAAAGGGIADNNTPHTVKIEVTAINIDPTQRTNVFYFAKTANKSSVRGMAINGSRGTSPYPKQRNNVYIAASNVTMSCNYIGTHADGASYATHESTDGSAGVYIELNTDDIVIENNLISGNGGCYGVNFAGASNNPRLHKNIIGLAADGVTELRNTSNSGSCSRGIGLGNASGADVYKNIIAQHTQSAIDSGWSNKVPKLKIRGNYLNTTISGLTSALASVSAPAIRSFTTDNGVIGGDSADDRNVVAGLLRVEDAENLTIKNNYIGVGKDGRTSLAKTDTAVYLGYSANNVNITQNVVGNAVRYGISGDVRQNPTTKKNICSNVSVKDNYIGVTKEGDDIANGSHGVSLGCDELTISGNVISNNKGAGIEYYNDFGSKVNIYGNIIGLKPDGVTPAPNYRQGINIAISGEARIGGPAANQRNIIAANKMSGISIGKQNAVTAKRIIQGNYIGVDKNGNPAGNEGRGIEVCTGGGNAKCGGEVLIGGAANGEGNVISANRSEGILYGQADQAGTESDNPVRIYGNIIGFKPDVETPAPNGSRAIDVRGNTNVHIGGAGQGEGNYIESGVMSGIFLLSLSDNGAHKFYVQGNKIGITKSGKIMKQPYHIQRNGIDVADPHQNYPIIKNGLVIGGDDSSAGNEIAGYVKGVQLALADGAVVKNNKIHDNNTGVSIEGDVSKNNQIIKNSIHDNITGVRVMPRCSVSRSCVSVDSPTTGNTIRQNSIYKNTYLGISLMDKHGIGEIENDDKDADTGANNLQNYPVAYELVDKCSNSRQDGVKKFNSTPNTTFVIDYYSNASWDVGGPLQAENYLGSETVTTDNDGNANFTFPTGAVNVTATATAPDGSTSEIGGKMQTVFWDCKEFNDSNRIIAARDIQSLETHRLFRSSLSRMPAVVKVKVDDQEVNATYDYLTGSVALKENTFKLGIHDLTLSVTDSVTGLTFTHTFKGAIKVVEPKINYNTVVTDNTLPNIPNGVPGENVKNGTVVLARVEPSGGNGLVKPYAFVYDDPTWKVPNGTATGSRLRAITSAEEYADYVMRTSMNLETLRSFNKILGGEDKYENISLEKILALCDTNQNTHLRKYVPTKDANGNITGYHFSRRTPPLAQNCKDYINFQTSQKRKLIIDSANSGFRFGPLPDGKYDVTFMATADLSDGVATTSQSLLSLFKAGLIIDTLEPSGTLTTSDGDTVSPGLTGRVNKPDAKIRLKINGKWYEAINNGDGTWMLPPGQIDDLSSGVYSVEVEITDRLGKIYRETKQLTITIKEKRAEYKLVDVKKLAKTGDNVYLLVVASLAVILGGVYLGLRRVIHKS